MKKFKTFHSSLQERAENTLTYTIKLQEFNTTNC